MSYFDATQLLRDKGYSEEQITQASYAFPYTEDSTPSDKATDGLPRQAEEAFGIAVMKDQTLDALRKEQDEAFTKSALLGRYNPWFLFRYIQAKADFEAAKFELSASTVRLSYVVVFLGACLLYPLAGWAVIRFHLKALFMPAIFIAGIILLLIIRGQALKHIAKAK